MVKPNGSRITALALSLMAAVGAGGCKEGDKAAVKDEWKTGKYVPPPQPTEKVKLEPLDRFACTIAGTLSTGRFDPVVSPLSDGRVLVAGGRQGKEWLSSSEIFDPRTGKSVKAGPMKEPRALQGSMLLADGRVLVYGGGARSLEVFDPRGRTWREVGRLTQEAVGVAAAQLANGTIYIAGGELTGKRAMATAAFVWSPKSGKLSALPDLKQGLRGEGFVTDDGKLVLLARLSEGDSRKLMLSNPKQGTLTPFEPEGLLFKGLKELGRSRGGEQVKLATGPDGKLIMPPTGLRGRALLRFFPSRMSWRSLAKLIHDHSGGAAAALSADRILVAGGSGTAGSTVEVCTKEPQQP